MAVFTLASTAAGNVTDGSVVGSVATSAGFNRPASGLTVVAVRAAFYAFSPVVTDTAGNTYVQRPGSASLSGSDRIFLFDCIGGLANASNIVTCTFGATLSYVAIVVAHYTIDATYVTFFDPVISSSSGLIGNNGGSNSTATSTAFTTNWADSMVVSAVSVGQLGNGYSAGSGYTKRISDAADVMTLEDKIATSIQTATTATVTWSLGPGLWEMVTAVYGARLISGTETYGPDPAFAAPGGSITINPGTTIQTIVDGQAAGKTYYLAAGTHRNQSVVLKTGDTLCGAYGAVMNGAKDLSPASGVTWTFDGTDYWAGSQTQQGTVAGDSRYCAFGAITCLPPEMLKVDGVVYTTVLSKGALATGLWYFDYAADKIYMRDNPAGRVIESASTPQAVTGPGIANITVRNLVIENYATPVGAGAVELSGSGCTVKHCEVRYNHYSGIAQAGTGTATYNYVHHNGCFGFTGSGTGITVDHNHISYNNTVGPAYDSYFGAGGSKWVFTESLTVSTNYSHHNNGPGLWTDISNNAVTYDSNTIDDNVRAGIFHELGYAAVISNNTIRRNGTERNNPGWVEGAGIQITTSRDVEIHHNTLIDNWQNIAALEDGRGDEDPGSQTHGTWKLVNLNVHDNSVTSTTNQGAANNDAYNSGVIKSLDAGTPNPSLDPFSVASNNKWTNNTYNLAVSGITTYFYWAGAHKTLTQWQAVPQDATTVAPTISSAAATTFTVAVAGTFSVTTTGTPTVSTLSKTGSLPTGVTFTDNGNGTATLAGTPGGGTTGSYPITITANNGVAPNATQSFTLTVNQVAAVTSANATTFTVSTPGTFSVTTSGVPAVTTVSKTGSLPSGVTFTDNGNGTATLAGTPGVGTGGAYPLTITAVNGVSPAGTQAFTLTVSPDATPPTVTSVSPVSGATGIGLSAPVTATFSEGMTSGTLTTSTFLLTANAVGVAGVVTYNAGTITATFTPSSALAPGTVYTATIVSGGSGAKDASANALAVDKVWTFTTASSTSAPTPATGVTVVDGQTAAKGTGTVYGPLSAVISVNTTATSTPATLVETDLWTYTLPANTLNADNKAIRVTAHGTFGADANNKTLKLYVGGVAVATFGPTAGNALMWTINAVLARKGAASEVCKTWCVAGTAVLGSGGNTGLTSDTTASIVIKITGTNGTATAGDVACDSAIVEALN